MLNTARKAKKAAQTPTPGHLQVVDKQSPDRLLNLMRARDRLRKQVLTKRKTFEQTATKIRDIAMLITGRTMPVAKKMSDIDKEIHSIFHALLAKGRLSKAAHLEVKWIYESLQADGAISPDPRKVSENDAWMDEVFSQAEASEGASGRHATPEEDLSSAERPGSGEGGQTLRSLFRKLAVAIHPDKAHGHADHARRAEAMKEVTQAYQNGDLARLLELEAAWLADGDLPESNDEAEVDRRCEQVALEIKQLTEELKDIALDLRELRASPPAQITKGLWRASPQKLEAEIANLEADGQEEVRRGTIVRDFAKSFLDGKITLKAFALGPPALRNKRKEVELTEDMILDLFLDGMARMGGEKQARGRRPRRR